MTRHEWVRKVIYWESFKKFKFDHSNKWYMHNQESILENVTHKIIWDFEIQTDYLISARQPDIEIVKKKKEPLFLVGLRGKLKESEKGDQ